MSQLLSKVVPLALAAAINPTGILVLMALLATAKRAGLALCVGFCAVFIAFGCVVLGFGLQLGLKPSLGSAIVDLVAAALIAFLGVRALRRGRRSAEEPKKRKHPIGAVEGLAAGAVLAVTDFSSIIPYIDALKEMLVAPVSSPDAWIALAVFLAIMLAPMILPVALLYAAPASAEKVLGPIRRVLQKHGSTIVAVVCFVLAVYLAEKGIRGL